ncbi:MAG: DegT/DnrJ/EryC1/StrS family aminotransferase [Cytophagales bacterium]|nr:DegT/DnrJ/EryC1/StrS family aminotransferase [Cytophagales bacterium]
MRPDGKHVYHLYVIRTKKRDDLKKYLTDREIGTGIHYPVPVHLQKAYIGKLQGSDNLFVTEKMANEILSLPMYPELLEEDVRITIKAINEFN